MIFMGRASITSAGGGRSENGRPGQQVTRVGPVIGCNPVFYVPNGLPRFHLAAKIDHALSDDEFPAFLEAFHQFGASQENMVAPDGPVPFVRAYAINVPVWPVTNCFDDSVNLFAWHVFLRGNSNITLLPGNEPPLLLGEG
jgi:hypothetical protein